MGAELTADDGEPEYGAGLHEEQRQRGTPGCDCDQLDNPDPAEHANDCNWRAGVCAWGEANAGLAAQREALLSALNQVLTILRDLDAPLDVRVNMAHDIANEAILAAVGAAAG